jgi:hypothetical protein
MDGHLLGLWAELVDGDAVEVEEEVLELAILGARP